MTHPSARKGSQFERDVVTYLRDAGFPNVERAYGAGRPSDVGDIDGLPGIVCELKACKALTFGPWCDETERERQNAHADYGIVIAKRRQKPVSLSFAVMPLWQLAALLRDRECA